MNHKMTTTTPFILLGFDADSFHNDKLMKMFRERGYNILFNSDESHFSSAWYAFCRNKKPTIVVNCFTDEERLKYQDLPAIIVRDDLPFQVLPVTLIWVASLLSMNWMKPCLTTAKKPLRKPQNKMNKTKMTTTTHQSLFLLTVASTVTMKA